MNIMKNRFDTLNCLSHFTHKHTPVMKPFPLSQSLPRAVEVSCRHHALFGRISRTSLHTLRAVAVGAIAACVIQDAGAASQTWTGGSTVDGSWSTGSNWNGGAAPGSTSGTSSTDTATFKLAIANTWGNSALNPVVIGSASQNIQSITFTGNAGSYFVGSTGGNSLYLTGNGTILATLFTNASLVTETINAPLVLAGSGYILKNDASSGNGANTGVLKIGGSITGGDGVSTNTTLTLQGANTNDNTISGNISNGTSPNLRITKSNAGTWILSGTNSYTGVTNVTAGTLLINGDSSSATGAVTVSSGATLGGIGTIGGDVTVNSGGILAPGTTADSTSVLTLNNRNLSLGGVDSKLNLNIEGTSAGSFDRVVGINSLTVNGDITITLVNTYSTASWDLLDFTSKSGNFDSVTLAGSYSGTLTLSGEVWSGTVGGQHWTFSQTSGVLSVVPEPRTTLLLAGALVVFVVFGRRRVI